MHLLWFTSVSFSLLIIRCTCQQFTVTPVTTSSGLYYEKIGDVLLSNNNWQFVTSVDYQGYLLFYEYLITQANKIQDFCREVALKECNSRYAGIQLGMRRIAETDETMAHYLGIEKSKRRVKRFWTELALSAAPYIFEPLGKGLAGKLFGNMDRANLEAFNAQIEQLQQGQGDIINSINQQATAFRIDSEKKNVEIQGLQRRQNEIKDKLTILEGTFILDSQQKEKQIEDLKSMLAETKLKIKQQEDIQNGLVKEVETIKLKLKDVNDDINYITSQIDKIKAHINVLNVAVKLNSISINFNFLLNEFEIKQKELFNVVQSANRGVLDAYVITPLNLVEMLEKVQPMLPEGTKFPLYPTIENASKLYNLIKPTVYLLNGKILFILQLPLVHYRSFNLLKMTSLPAPLGKSKFVFILPKQPYLLVDQSDEEYTLLSHQDFREYCRNVAKGVTLCEQIQQTSPVSLSRADCEIQLFLNSKEIPQSCNKRVVSLEKPIFLQLKEPHTWIYAVPDSEILTFNCINRRESVSVEGSGIVHTNSNCSVRTSDLKISPIDKFSKPVSLTYSPHVNLTDFIDISDTGSVQSKSTLSSSEQLFSPFDFERLKDISFDVKEISASNMKVMNYFIIAVGIVTLILLVLFVLFRKK